MNKIFFFQLTALLVIGIFQLNAAQRTCASTLNSEIITINKTTMYKDNSICKCDYLIGNDMIIIEGNVTIEAKDTSQFIGTFKCRENAVLTLITKTVPKERFFTIHAEASSSYTILDK